MAGTTTPNYTFYLPAKGEIGDDWFTKMNANFTDIDTILANEHNVDGTHEDITADSITVSGGVIASNGTMSIAGHINFTRSSDVTLVDGSGILQLGSDGGVNIGLDANEIQARDGASGASVLHLNLGGGDISLGHSSSQVTVAGELILTGSASSPPTANTLTKENVVNAWAYVTVGGGSPSINDAFNIDVIDDDGAGNYGINFETNMSDATYFAGGSCVSGSAHMLTVNAFNTAYFDILIFDDDGAAADNVSFCVMAIGDQ